MLDTKVIKILDRNGISYRLLRHSKPVFTVEAAAEERGVATEEMVKSILLRDRDGRYVMACVTGNARLDPKAVRAQLPPEWKRLSFATPEEIVEVTGYVQGAVAPVGLPDEIVVIFDEAIAECEKVNISSGDPLAGLELNPSDLIKITSARIARIAKKG